MDMSKRMESFRNMNGWRATRGCAESEKKERVMKVFNSFVFGSIAALALAVSTAPAFAQEETAPAVDPAATDAAVDPLAVEIDPATGLPVEGDALVEAAPAEEVIAPIQESTEAAENPYGLTSLWTEGNTVTRSTLIILIIMSVGSWFIFITKMLSTNALRGQAIKAGKKFQTAASVEEAIAGLDQSSVFRKIAADGLAAAEHHARHLEGKVGQYEWVSLALRRSVDEISGRLQGGNAILATVGSMAPFVGLFGTVWGILQALIAIGVSGQASIDKVAGPVGEALIMTAIGLAVAVPAVGFYNIVIRRNKGIVDALRKFSDDVEAFLVSGSRIEGPARRRK